MAAGKDLSLRWNELEPVVAFHTVRLTLPDGHRVEGRESAVEPEALRLAVDARDKKNRRTDELSIPWTSVTTIQVMSEGKVWSTLGMMPGVIVTAAAMVAANFTTWAYVGVDGGGFAKAGGYYLGKQFDRRVTTVRIIAGP